MAAKSNEDLKLVKELAKILDGSDLTEIEMKKGELKVRVSKRGDGSTSGGPGWSVMPAAATPVATAPAAAAPAPAIPAMAQDAPKTGHPDAVKSPMVGTAYLRPSPDADLFANVGDSVKEGETIMLVEAMKTFNPIVAPKSGTLRDVFVEDAQAVEFGDAMFLID